jgi:hypothetical protein
MKKVTSKAIDAFLSAKKFNSQNTRVIVLPNVTILTLFGNEIAYLYNDPERTLSITNCSYFTNTTKERLNGIPGIRINQKNYIWYLNGIEWDGKLIDIKNK